MVYPLHNKESETVLNKVKRFCIYYGYPEEIGDNNGKEFNNSSLNKFLTEHNIKMIHGRLYNPHSQGSVERLHQTLKKAKFSFYNEIKDYYNIKETIITICNNYNSRNHFTTQYTPKQIFFLIIKFY